MPRKRVRKTDRGTVKVEVYQKAAEEHFENKTTIRSCAKKYNVCHVTLNRFIKKVKSGNAATVGYRSVNRVFTDEEEKVLEDYILLCSHLYYVLSPKEVRKLAYQLAIKYEKRCPTTWHDNKTAGLEWLAGFLKRHPILSLASSRANVSVANSYSDVDAQRFYENLTEVMDSYDFEPKDVWSMDEIGIGTVLSGNDNADQKVNTHEGGSAEGRKLISVALAVNAQGERIPPFFVFPLKEYQDSVRQGPVGSAGAANSSGLMEEQEFLKFLEFFKAQTIPSDDQKCLLLLDNHKSHISISSIDFCKRNGIILLLFPPCCVQIQPLYRSVFGPFKKIMNEATDDWMQNNRDRTMSIHSLLGIVRKAFPFAVSAANIVAGFEDTGICPLNKSIFTLLAAADYSNENWPKLSVDPILLYSDDVAVPKEEPNEDYSSSSRSDSGDMRTRDRALPVGIIKVQRNREGLLYFDLDND